WSFSLRVSSARCCTSPTSCEQLGSCEDLAIGICLRSPDTPVEDRESCSVFFLTDNGSDIIDRQLTPADAFRVRIKNPMTNTDNCLLYRVILALLPLDIREGFRYLLESHLCQTLHRLTMIP
ncbi:hypothetical protein GBAR_LOCUS2940, partial [Geodia barretti]